VINTFASCAAGLGIIFRASQILHSNNLLTHKRIHHHFNVYANSCVAFTLCGGGGAIRPLPRDGGVENSTETQQSGHAPRYEPNVKNGSSAKDGAPKRLRCGTIQKEVS